MLKIKLVYLGRRIARWFLLISWRRMIRGIGAKALVFFIGLAVILLLIELALTVFGRVVTSDEDVTKVLENREELADADFIIACFGDSHTFGIGATSKENAFPAQLERILSKRYPALNIRVLNHGVPATNSSQQYNNLMKILPVYPRPPDVVYFLSFGSNPWNLGESSAIEEGYAKLPPDKMVYVNMEKVRVGKLAVLLKLYRGHRERLTSYFARLNTPEGPYIGGPAPEGPNIGGPAPEGPYIGGPAPEGPNIGGPVPEGPYIGGASPEGPYIEGASPEGPNIGGPAPRGNVVDLS